MYCLPPWWNSAATVGTPVARRPLCSPGRAVFPHPVPRLHSLPRRVIPCLLSPAGRLAHAVPVRHVRDEFPFRDACFRRVLPHPVGFPCHSTPPPAWPVFSHSA